MQAMTTPQAQPDPWEHTLEQTGHPRFFLDLRDEELASALSERIPHRAIGVTYDPSNEQNNYVPTVLPQRYDAFIFIRDTDVLSPLDYSPAGITTPATQSGSAASSLRTPNSPIQAPFQSVLPDTC